MLLVSIGLKIVMLSLILFWLLLLYHYVIAGCRFKKLLVILFNFCGPEESIFIDRHIYYWFEHALCYLGNTHLND